MYKVIHDVSNGTTCFTIKIKHDDKCDIITWNNFIYNNYYTAQQFYDEVKKENFKILSTKTVYTSHMPEWF